MNNIIIFDGTCVLCNRFIMFLDREKGSDKFFYTTNTSATAQDIISRMDVKMPASGSILFFRNGVVYQESTAVINIFMCLGGWWKMVQLIKVIPVKWRDAVYKRVARSRHTIFGRSDSCQLQHKVSPGQVLF